MSACTCCIADSFGPLMHMPDCARRIAFVNRDREFERDCETLEDDSDELGLAEFDRVQSS